MMTEFVSGSDIANNPDTFSHALSEAVAAIVAEAQAPLLARIAALEEAIGVRVSPQEQAQDTAIVETIHDVVQASTAATSVDQIVSKVGATVASRGIAPALDVAWWQPEIVEAIGARRGH